jgi:polyferredoxin
MNLENEFHEAMLELYKLAKTECNYNATRFLRMVSKHGGVKTAKILLATDKPSEGYVTLWECGRLDLTVEACVVKPEFVSLFTDEELKTAKERLKAYGYKDV